jgi:hypothetical protein
MTTKQHTRKQQGRKASRRHAETPAEFRQGLNATCAPGRARLRTKQARLLLDALLDAVCRAYERGGLAEAQHIAEQIEQLAEAHTKQAAAAE